MIAKIETFDYKFYFIVFKVKRGYLWFFISEFFFFDFLNKISVFLPVIYKKKLLYANNNLFFFFNIFWARIIFVGKYFRIRNYRKIKLIDVFSGRSHWTKLKFENKWLFFKVRRKNYIWYTNSLESFKVLRLTLGSICPVNKYTRRGLRFKRQTIRHQFGKILSARN